MTIAKEIEVENPFENMGAQLVREVASKTNDIAGDGTTTATVLAQAMVKEGLKSVAAGLPNLMQVKKGIDKAVPAAAGRADQFYLTPSKSRAGRPLPRSPTISANGHPLIGEMLAEAMEKVTSDGVITVEESKRNQHPGRDCGRHVVRQGLHLPLLRYGPPSGWKRASSF